MNERTQDFDGEWDIERYLLDDPSLDSQAFEDRMLHDEALALAVSEGVRRLELLARASDSLSPPASSTPVQASLANDGKRQSVGIGFALVVAAAGLAASLLMAVIWSQWVEHRGLAEATVHLPGGTSSDEKISAVASRWLAIQLDNSHSLDDAHVGEARSSEDLHFTSASFEWLEQGEQATNSDVNEGDWMLETSAEFFQQADI